MITVVIIVHNVPSRTEILSMTETCLRTLKENTPERHQLLLIDNGSRDNGLTFDLLTQYGEPVIKHVENESISKCWNTAIDVVTDEVVVVNNDVVFHKPFWLSELISPLSNPAYGAVGSKRLNWNGFEFLEGSFLAFMKSTALSIAENGKVFDEQFTFTCEDADFCHRMLRSGRQLIVAPIEEMGYVTHLHHGSLSWSNEDGGWNGRSILDIMHESRVKLCRKYGKADRVND